MEAATKLEGKPERVASSFAKSLFLGEIREEMVFPWPEPNPDEQDRIREPNAAAREIGSRMDHRRIEEERWVGDRVVRELGEAGLCGLYVDERYGGQGLSQTGYARVLETFAQIDATLSIVLGVHQSIGDKGIALSRHRYPEGALPARPRRRPQAGRVRADRARGGIRRLRDPIASRAEPDGSLGPERREALHRQRLQGGGLHRFRPVRGRRQGQAHRPDPGEGNEGLRGGRAPSTRWDCGATTCAASTSRT